MTVESLSPEVEPPRPRRGGNRLAALLASVPFASVVVASLAIACILGTVLPQGGDAARYLAKNPDAADRMELLRFLGLTHVFSAWWFLGLLGLLSASLAVCTWRKIVMIRKRTGRGLGRLVGSVLTHVSFLLVLAGGVVRGTMGEKGVLALTTGQTRHQFNGNGTQYELPFAVRLVAFDVEHYEADDPALTAPVIAEESLHIVWTEQGKQWHLPVELDTAMAVRTQRDDTPTETVMGLVIRQRVLDFVIDSSTGGVGNRSDQPNNPAIQVELTLNTSTNTQWLFARHPDFNMHDNHGEASLLDQLKLRYDVKVRVPQTPPVKDYRSTLEVIENDAVVLTKTIEVNDPLSHRGYTFYQSGFDPRRPNWTSLQVVRDPGVPLVYGGFLMMIVGLAAVFYLYPQNVSPSGSKEPSA